MDGVFTKDCTFSDAMRLMRQFHGVGQMLPALPENYTVPVSMGFNAATMQLATIEGLLQCDFAACAGIAKGVEADTQKWLREGFYQKLPEAMAIPVDPVFALICYAYMRMIAANQSPDRAYEENRTQARRKFYRDRKICLLSETFARKVNICSENTALAKHVMDRANIPSSYVGGKIYLPDIKHGEWHAFLAVRQNDHAVVFDPSVGTYAPPQSGVPELYLRDEKRRMPLPGLFAAPMADFERMLDKGRNHNSWVRMESVWKGASSNARMYYGFSMYANGGVVKAGLVNPRRPA